MGQITFRTAGESHGRGLTALIEGIPAGLSLEMERDVDPELEDDGQIRDGEDEPRSDTDAPHLRLAGHA